MVRWRYCLVLAILLLLPPKAIAEEQDDEDPDDENDDNNENNDNDDTEEEDTTEKADVQLNLRRVPATQLATAAQFSITRTLISRQPLECYVCVYKAETQLKSCLDPTKLRVQTMTCHSVDDKCFTTVISKVNTIDSVLRGCQSTCVGSPEITCCELSRCNNQAFALPSELPRKLVSNKSTKIPQTVLFFVTVLLVLQTVVKVAVV